MVPVGSIVSDAASGVGFIAATIAVCGFLAQAPPALMQKDDQTVRTLTVIGGLIGIVIAVGVILSSRMQ
ncbi:MAG TPA: hypothetical protein VFJ65_04445 [Solirubrobacterales bacterium]|nr:hypothetical protein [Solirubrobacterales bacterium]